MEYVNGRSLSDLTKEYQLRRIPEAVCKQIFLQICKGINYLHNLHISHRDIKLENILLDSSNTVKIIDFGFGVFSPVDGLQEFYCGTPNYMPPEIVLKTKYIGQYADLWSLGVLLFKLLCGEFPFRALSEKELYDIIKKGKYDLPNHLSEDAVNLIKGLLLMDPFNRNHCDIVIMHKWFIINGIPIEIKEDKPDNKPITNESKEAKDKESKDVKEEAKEEEEKEANV